MNFDRCCTNIQDVIYKQASKLVPIEIKSSKTFNKRFLKEIDYFSQLFPEQCERGYVIYAGEQSQAIGWRSLLRFYDVSDIYVE